MRELTMRSYFSKRSQGPGADDGFHVFERLRLARANSCSCALAIGGRSSQPSIRPVPVQRAANALAQSTRGVNPISVRAA